MSSLETQPPLPAPVAATAPAVDAATAPAVDAATAPPSAKKVRLETPAAVDASVPAAASDAAAAPANAVAATDAPSTDALTTDAPPTDAPAATEAAPTEAAPKAEDNPCVEVMLDGINKHAGPANVRKALTNAGITGWNRVRRPVGHTNAFLRYPTAEALAADAEKLSTFTMGRDKITWKHVAVRERQAGRMQQLAGRRATLLALDGDDQRTPDERLADQVTPLWRKPYDMQLQKKQTEVMHVMRDLTGALGLRSGSSFIDRHLRRFKKSRNQKRHQPDSEMATEDGDDQPPKPTVPLPGDSNTGLLPGETREDRGRRQLRYLEGAMVAYAGAPCPVGTIVPAPQPNGYRNKCEFTFGVDVNGELTVGFLCGLFKEGHTAVLGPDACLHVSDAAKHVARALQAYARDSGLPAYDRHTKTGFWRLAVVRTNETGEIQVIVQANGGATTASRLAAVTEGLVPFWAETAATIHRAAAAGAGADTDTDAPASTPAPATSLLFQDWRGDFNGFPGTVSAPVTVLSGLPYITERLLGLDFRISPGAFFQVNTPATIGLYTYLREAVLAAFAAAAPSDASAPRPPSLVLDLCCGTGTIGLAIAPAVTHVIGVEMVPAAVDDAKANAAAQGQTNIEFICSKVEDAMDQVVARGSAIVKAALQAREPPASADEDPAASAAAGAAALTTAAGTAPTTADDTATATADDTATTTTDDTAMATVAGTVPVTAAGAAPAAADDTAPATAVDTAPATADDTAPATADDTAPATAVDTATATAVEAPQWVAILDPPRAGVHPSVIRAIRMCPQITSIIYVACNAKAVVSSDWMTLCSPTSKKLSGRPFRPVRAQPFDLFPHTPHYELVVEFTR